MTHCKAILLPIRESEVAESLIEAAIGIATRQGAHLNALYVHPHPRTLTPYATLGLTRSMREALETAATAASREQAARLHELFSQRCDAGGLALRSREASPGEAGADFVERQGVRSDIIARHGHLSDLVVVPRPNRTSPPPSSFESAVRETGRAVLMLPRNTVPAIIGRSVVIGWNASKEAARAVATALPYLGDSTVHVLCSEKRMQEEPNGAELVTYLACHGVDASVRVFDSGAQPVGSTLLETCRDVDADLLVIGGYSRSRVREMVMGGVTGHLIAHAGVAVLMVH